MVKIYVCNVAKVIQARVKSGHEAVSLHGELGGNDDLNLGLDHQDQPPLDIIRLHHIHTSIHQYHRFDAKRRFIRLERQEGTHGCRWTPQLLKTVCRGLEGDLPSAHDTYAIAIFDKKRVSAVLEMA